MFFLSSSRASWYFQVVCILFLGVTTIGRLILQQHPELDIQWNGFIKTRISDLNVIALWILLTVLCGTSTHSTSSLSLHSFNTKWSKCLCLGVVLYDLYIIRGIYLTWTMNFALIVQLLQFLPASALIIHSIYQLRFITSGYDRQHLDYRNLSSFGVINFFFNCMMLIHLVTLLSIWNSQHDNYQNAVRIGLAICEFLNRMLALWKYGEMVYKYLWSPTKPQNIQESDCSIALTLSNRDVKTFAMEPKESSYSTNPCEETSKSNQMNTCLVVTPSTWTPSILMMRTVTVQ